MNDLRTAAQQALAALEQDNPSGRTATITALRAALAQQAEPMAAVAENATTQQRAGETPPSDYRRGYWDGFEMGKREGRIAAEDAAKQAEPVEPAALTDEEILSVLRLAPPEPSLWPHLKDEAVVGDVQRAVLAIARAVEAAHGIGRQTDPQIEDRLARHGIPKP
jgi:hypothetical protein